VSAVRTRPTTAHVLRRYKGATRSLRYQGTNESGRHDDTDSFDTERTLAKSLLRSEGERGLSNADQQMPSAWVDVSLSSSSVQVLRILQGETLQMKVTSTHFL
jgi:hypothetical protein